MKYIVYKATGGLAHMISEISVVLKIAIKNNNYLIIDCKKHEAFAQNFSDQFYINNNKLKYSDTYDIIPKDNITYNIIPKKIIRHDSIWNLDIKNIIEKIKLEKNLIKEYYISVHYRNTDIKNNFDKYIKKIKKIIKISNIKIIYLATDDYYAYDKFIKNVTNIKIIQYSVPPQLLCKGKNIHYNMKDKYLLVFNCLVDMYMILNSTIFIPSYNSGLSSWLIQMINNKKNIFDIKSQSIIVKKF